jgi:hypothetical protein
MLGRIIPTDFRIFFRGVEITNQFFLDRENYGKNHGMEFFATIFSGKAGWLCERVAGFVCEHDAGHKKSTPWHQRVTPLIAIHHH